MLLQNYKIIYHLSRKWINQMMPVSYLSTAEITLLLGNLKNSLSD
jgi:hypothetical protein